MKLCKYWAKADGTATDKTGFTFKISKWGGSDTGAAEARREAEQALAATIARMRDVVLHKYRDDYSYSMRDVPEELITRFDANSGITRNGKGCLVLNTNDMFFADVDLPRIGFFAKLFGATPEKNVAQHMARLQNWLTDKPDVNVRVYRTAAGLRYLFTHMPLAVNDETLRWLKELESDKLYVQLCRNQKCFRARLTPKPFRVRCGSPPGHYPYETADKQDAFAKWLAVYEQQGEPYATCRFTESFGSGRIDPHLQKLVTAHDSACRVESDLPLA
ncbi:MAG: hypothetical protein PW788_03350 [Micavibrio sp.]|nr:hypothetical protein [Micavibrio sp.]